VVEVDVGTGRLWQPQCGASVVEVFLSGTEPREPCGGYFDYGQLMAGYQEPPMFTDSMAMDMQIEGVPDDMRIVKDPDAVDISENDTTGFASDSIVAEPAPPAPRVQDTLARPIEPPRRRERIAPPVPRPEPQPQPQPPVVIPPVDSTPAPLPRDSLVKAALR
jgi:hypothetical protein